MASQPSHSGSWSYYEILTAAVSDLSEHGYDSPERVAYWVQELSRAAYGALPPETDMERKLKEALAAKYKSTVDGGAIAKYHPEIARWQVERLKPQLQRALNNRIIASADLIKLNRKDAIEKTLQRFQGWATSIPAGGSASIDKNKEKTTIRKSLAQLPFVERRVLIDQSAKLVASIHEVVAIGGGAIALRWHSHWRQAGYNYRPDHKERDGHVYLMRNSWAHDQGLVRANENGYYDQITAISEEPFCRCYATFLYSLGKLPDDMLTERGRDKLAEVKEEMSK